MGVAEEFLALAIDLATRADETRQQVWLRRSISTAYYAVFHLLVSHAVEKWHSTPEVRLNLQRVFQHKNMREISQLIWNERWRAWSTRLIIPVELREVARLFVQLQQARHEADYDNSKVWTKTEALEKAADAEKAFHLWEIIRVEPAANEFLLALLVGRKRE